MMFIVANFANGDMHIFENVKDFKRDGNFLEIKYVDKQKDIQSAVINVNNINYIDFLE